MTDLDVVEWSPVLHVPCHLTLCQPFKMLPTVFPCRAIEKQVCLIVLFMCSFPLGWKHLLSSLSPHLALPWLSLFSEEGKSIVSPDVALDPYTALLHSCPPWLLSLKFSSICYSNLFIFDPFPFTSWVRSSVLPGWFPAVTHRHNYLWLMRNLQSGGDWWRSQGSSECPGWEAALSV